jgi:hypothetical protein
LKGCEPARRQCAAPSPLQTTAPHAEPTQAQSCVSGAPQPIQANEPRRHTTTTFRHDPRHDHQWPPQTLGTAAGALFRWANETKAPMTSKASEKKVVGGSALLHQPSSPHYSAAEYSKGPAAELGPCKLVPVAAVYMGAAEVFAGSGPRMGIWDCTLPAWRASRAITTLYSFCGRRFLGSPVYVALPSCSFSASAVRTTECCRKQSEQVVGCSPHKVALRSA